ncbi:DUF177 domain-containing protein [Robbsia sp. Bb-Pol-6]|uniref:Large ribosomal RNA subunit accumulation protein YceD n=1 Tax=Robbsia betulipollinis TaxID=2981849 RepID=A0ABT3ZQL1_9BURK|nr:DUF177 domain-containing protein [Robbsia betulipollinis]MCY0388562.1 DUF177 domain-containing protein [Robbsia betulipollinis]
MSKDTADQHGAAASGAVPEARQGRDDLRAFDLTAFIRARREMRGTAQLGDLARMVDELPADAPANARDALLTWFVRGETRREVRREAAGNGALTTSSHTVSQPYLTLEARGRSWLECQRCMQALAFPIEIDTVYRVMDSDAEADAIALDDSEIEVIVGSASFDLIDLIDEEVVLSLPMVPKHDVCPAVHESVVSGADGSLGVESVADIDARLAAEEAVALDPVGMLDADTPLADMPDAAATPDGTLPNGRARADGGRPNPFAALASLRGKLPSDDDKKQ